MSKQSNLKEFRESGLLWLVNSILHVFGWALYMNLGEDGELTDFFPARTAARGFPEKSNDAGYARVSKYMLENAQRLLDEAEDQ